VVAALERLHRRGWTRLASGSGSRARKYRHLLDQALAIEREQVAVLCVLMLRGPQTPGELKQRTERLHAFPELAAITVVLDELIGRELVARLPRRPGHKEERYVHLLGPETETQAHVDEPEPPPAESRLDRIEREVGELRAEVATLKSGLSR
jgi:uncharacterized protein YceH (UPF0502 family)